MLARNLRKRFRNAKSRAREWVGEKFIYFGYKLLNVDFSRVPEFEPEEDDEDPLPGYIPPGIAVMLSDKARQMREEGMAVANRQSEIVEAPPSGSLAARMADLRKH